MHDSERPRTAVQALEAHLALIPRDIERWLALFADDAIVEFPYAPSLGMPARLVGKPAIRAYFERTPAVFQGLRFRDVRVYAVAGGATAIAEAHGSATIATTGQAYEQDYVMVVDWADGAIVRYREYWDAIRALEAMGGRAAVLATLGGA